jgi:hypothetical protein
MRAAATLSMSPPPLGRNHAEDWTARKAHGLEEPMLYCHGFFEGPQNRGKEKRV